MHRWSRISVSKCISPCWHIGGEVGTVVGVHKFGGASDVLPLGWGRTTCRRGSQLFHNQHHLESLCSGYLYPSTLFQAGWQSVLATFKALAGWVYQSWLRLIHTGIQANLTFIHVQILSSESIPWEHVSKTRLYQWHCKGGAGWWCPLHQHLVDFPSRRGAGGYEGQWADGTCVCVAPPLPRDWTLPDSLSAELATRLGWAEPGGEKSGEKIKGAKTYEIILKAN